jgi:RNA polymerase sigma-70 factor (ECF subfamily)
VVELKQSSPYTAAAAQSLSEIYRAELRYVWRLVWQLGVAEREIEDLVHDVFVVVYRQLPTYDTSRPLRPWLAGIAFRVVSNHRRRFCNRNELAAQPLIDIYAQDTSCTEQKVLRRQEQHLVRRALDRLAPERRAVFVLHELNELSMPEVAQIIDTPLNTLYSRLRLARRQFAAEIEELMATKPKGSSAK